MYSNQFPRQKDIEKLTINERANILYSEIAKNEGLKEYIRNSINKDKAKFNSLADKIDESINKIAELI